MTCNNFITNTNKRLKKKKLIHASLRGIEEQITIWIRVIYALTEYNGALDLAKKNSKSITLTKIRNTPHEVDNKRIFGQDQQQCKYANKGSNVKIEIFGWNNRGIHGNWFQKQVAQKSHIWHKLFFNIVLSSCLSPPLYFHHTKRITESNRQSVCN